MPRSANSLPELPPLLRQKLTKTGYTRGASTREIFQNRVTRNNTVLIDWRYWDVCSSPDDGATYENGLICVVSPRWYFDDPKGADAELRSAGLELGRNALLLFTLRADWDQCRPGSGRLPNGKAFQVATSRVDPLGGTYFARVAGTVSAEGREIIEGYDTSAMRGAGIRVYEYASQATISRTRTQLECLVWMCSDSEKAMEQGGMTVDAARSRKAAVLESAAADGLVDIPQLIESRIVNSDGITICPLCKEELSATDFMRRGEQALGREVHDLTITELSLFHIQELRVGQFQHRPYNLGWGHHHCNVVVKDSGIAETLEWMKLVLRNQDSLAE